MGDVGTDQTLDKSLDKTSDSKADSGTARTEAAGGMKDLADGTKDYYQARKGGMRDKDTQEILGAQPQFFDSSLAANKMGAGDEASDKVAAKAGGKDAGSDKQYPDGSVVHTDANNRVTDVTTADGKTRSFKYDDSGKLTEYPDKDGSTWQKRSTGDVWDKVDKDGKSNESFTGTVAVTKDGEILKEQDSGTKLTPGEQPGTSDAKYTGQFTELEHRDGSYVRGYPDGAQTNFDSQDRIKDVTRPDGKKTTFQYDEEGKLDHVKDADGNTYERRPSSGGKSDSWVEYDKAGKKSRYLQDVQVDDNGNMLSKDNSGNSETRYRDGGHREYNENTGQGIAHDKNGRITEINYPGGATRTFGYDHQGHLNGMWETRHNEKGMNYWIGSKDGWSEGYQDADGGFHSKPMDGTPSITKDGQVVVMKPNRQFEVLDRDGRLLKGQQ